MAQAQAGQMHLQKMASRIIAIQPAAEVMIDGGFYAVRPI